jgi:hypothetical protein
MDTINKRDTERERETGIDEKNQPTKRRHRAIERKTQKTEKRVGGDRMFFLFLLVGFFLSS